MQYISDYVLTDRYIWLQWSNELHPKNCINQFYIFKAYVIDFTEKNISI